MKHSFLDIYSSLDSPLHKIDARIKIITFISCILFTIFTPVEAFGCFSLYIIILMTLVFVSKLPVSFVLRRSLVIIPFVLLISLFNLAVNKDILFFLNILIKAYISILCMILLSSTTRFDELLKGMQSLKCPKLIIMILSFMYRYTFILLDEILRMKRAKESRQIQKATNWFEIKTIAQMIGSLFVRSYERGERVYYAMCSRGFKGDVITNTHFKLKRQDLIFMFSIILPVGSIWIKALLK